MHQAGTNVFVGLFSISTILSLLLPLEAPVSNSVDTHRIQGSSFAVVKNDGQAQSASDSAQLSLIDDLKIASFEENNAFVDAIRREGVKQEDKTVLASAKQPQVQSMVLTHPTLEASNSAEAQPQTVVAVEPTIVAEQDTSGFALNPDVLFDRVNNHRVSIGLAPVQRDERLMIIARERAPELFDEIFVTWNMHAGFNARHANLPYWATENMIYYNNEEGAMNWWLNSPVHRGTIENGTYTHAGIACEGKACAMIYSAFVPK